MRHIILYIKWKEETIIALEDDFYSQVDMVQSGTKVEEG